MSNLRIGFALCGSFCTFEKALTQMEMLCQTGYEVLPILSYHAASVNTRFGQANDFIQRMETLCQRKVIRTIEEAEPIGPKKMTDIMIVAPCTGNTAAKLAHAITDTPVTMAVKSHLRQEKPVLLCLATNDALGASAQNIGRLLNTKHYYFVPFSQDDPVNKPNSLVADFRLLPQAMDYALREQQLQPVLQSPRPGRSSSGNA